MTNNRRITLMRPSQIFDSFMDEFFNSPTLGSFGDAQCDIYETETDIHVDMKIPGFKKEDIEINIEGDILTVSGKVHDEKLEEDKKKNFFMQEIKHSEFQRSVTMPAHVKAEEATAKVEDGILKITVPKHKTSKPKKIEIAAD